MNTLKLISPCCGAEVDQFGFPSEDGLWQDKCLQCGSRCRSTPTKEHRHVISEYSPTKIGKRQCTLCGKWIEYVGDTVEVGMHINTVSFTEEILDLLKQYDVAKTHEDETAKAWLVKNLQLLFMKKLDEHERTVL